jgi:hypothetical protein
VNAPAVVTTHPAPVAICAGGNASFSVTGTGTGLSYQWQVSTNNGGSYSDMAGATSATLILNNVASTMSGNLYRAVLSSTSCAGVASNGAALTVHALPSITLNLTGPSSLLPGQQAVLTAIPTSSGGTVITNWFLNNNALAVTGNSTTVDIENLGAYHATIQETWADGSVCSAQSAVTSISAAASSKLFIFPNPNEGRFTVSYYNSAGTTSSRTVTVYDSKGSAVYQEKFAITGPYTLLDIDITPAMRGTYMVMVSDAGGKKLAEGKIIVQ